MKEELKQEVIQTVVGDQPKKIKTILKSSKLWYFTAISFSLVISFIVAFIYVKGINFPIPKLKTDLKKTNNIQKIKNNKKHLIKIANKKSNLVNEKEINDNSDKKINEEVVKKIKDLIVQKNKIKKENEELKNKLLSIKLSHVPKKDNEELKKELDSLVTELTNVKLQSAKLDKTIKENKEKDKTIKEKTIALLKHSMAAEKARILKRLKESEKDKKMSEKRNNSIKKLVHLREVELERSQKNIAKLEEMLREKTVNSQNKNSDENIKDKNQLIKFKNELKKEKIIRHYNVGALLSDLGRFEDAVTQYKMAIEIDPEFADAYYNLGIIYDIHLNKKNLALIQFKKYIKINPFTPDIKKVEKWIKEIGE